MATRLEIFFLHRKRRARASYLLSSDNVFAAEVSAAPQCQRAWPDELLIATTVNITLRTDLSFHTLWVVFATLGVLLLFSFRVPLTTMTFGFINPFSLRQFSDDTLAST
jgi:predicted branched-subunit amino acid permease